MLRCSSKGKNPSTLTFQLLQFKRRVKKLKVSGKFPFVSCNIYVYFGGEIHDTQHMALELHYLKLLFLLCPLVASEAAVLEVPRVRKTPCRIFKLLTLPSPFASLNYLKFHASCKA